jgi:hypothetical protein
MASDTISRNRARTIRLASQAAAGVFVGGAVLVALVGLPFIPTTEPEAVSYERVIEDAQVQAETIRAGRQEARRTTGSAPVDLEAIEYSLQMVQNAPKPKDTPPETPTVVETPTPTPDDGGRTRYLGTVTVGNRLMALVSAGGAQRILGEGQTVTLGLAPGDYGEAPSVEIVRVTPEAVWVNENGRERRVERSQRTGLAVSHGAMPPQGGNPGDDPSAARAAAIEAFNEAAAGADKPINPDEFRRDDGTIDYEALRAAARARARARQDVRRARDESGQD